MIPNKIAIAKERTKIKNQRINNKMLIIKYEKITIEKHLTKTLKYF